MLINNYCCAETVVSALSQTYNKSVGMLLLRETKMNSGCSSLKSINIPNTVISINQGAFQGCSALQTVEISDASQLTSIGYNAFAQCSALTEMYIPNRVTSIGSSVFSYCSALTDIYCEVSSIPKGWDAGQFSFDCQPEVFWDVSQSEYDAIMNNASVPYDIPQPTISVDSGNVTITCDKTFAHIYYTINGEAPTADNSTLYTEPFAVSEGDTIKAVAYVGNDIYSTVAEYVVE